MSTQRVVIGDSVVVKYDHPHRADKPEYVGVLETIAPRYIRIKREDGSYRSFHKSNIISVNKR